MLSGRMAPGLIYSCLFLNLLTDFCDVSLSCDGWSALVCGLVLCLNLSLDGLTNLWFTLVSPLFLILYMNLLKPFFIFRVLNFEMYCHSCFVDACFDAFKAVVAVFAFDHFGIWVFIDDM